MKSQLSYKLSDWLPTSVKEVEARGWKELDVILFTGDAYVDHPSFGMSVIGRVIESMGLKVAIVPQPNWRDDLRDFKKLGKPRLFFGVSAGNMDSMVNHYTANRRLRSDDAYTPDLKSGYRPDYAAYVYTNIIKKLYPETPIVLGGIEASLRRFTHYDYWSDTLKPGILAEAKADLLVYGMGESAIRRITLDLMQGKAIAEITNIPQTSYLSNILVSEHTAWKTLTIASHENCLKNKTDFALTFKTIEEESNKLKSSRIVQSYGSQFIVVNPAGDLYTEAELDAVYDLPFTRLPHPRYQGKMLSAYEMIKHSINIHRGCFGGCSFCTISAHQGKFIQNRSEASIIKEVNTIASMADFKGHLSDLGGPSANMYRMHGIDLKKCEACKRYSCIHPALCMNLKTDHSPLISLYGKASEQPLIKKVNIGSGVRYDLFLDNPQTQYRDSHQKYFEVLFKDHVSGRLKIAPEHSSDEVLKLMRKPSFSLFIKLKKWFDTLNVKYDMKQQLIPYFISNHPGCTLADMGELAVATKDLGYRLEQVQGFTPTPMTLSSVMYYSGLDPFTMKAVQVAKTREDQQNQQTFFFWYKKENQSVIRNLLLRIKRQDLIQKIYGNYR